MSSLTALNFAQMARDRITEKSEAEAGFSVITIEGFVDDALNNLTVKVAGREDFRELQKSYSVTAAAGVIALPDATVLVDWLAQNGTLILGGKVFKALDSYYELTLRRATDTGWWTVHNRQIHIRDITTGTLGTCVLTGTLVASNVPTLSELPARYERELVDELVKLTLGKVGIEARPAMMEAAKEPPVKLEVGGN